jgi:hypothetical protein
VRCGHDPDVVSWSWPFLRLLRFIHADLRRNGVKCYFTNRPQVSLADLKAKSDNLLSELDDYL